MGEVKPPDLAMLFAGLLIAPSCPAAEVYDTLEKQIGPISLKSPFLDFTFTKYYEPEMGSRLKRQFVVFEKLVAPDELVRIKNLTNSIEQSMAVDGKRRVNIDPGYFTAAKLVLVTTKDHAHRLYLGDGIYGEITLLFQRGAFEALPWTYPDYRSAAYQDFFMVMRRNLLERLRKRRAAG